MRRDATDGSAAHRTGLSYQLTGVTSHVVLLHAFLCRFRWERVTRAEE